MGPSLLTAGNRNYMQYSTSEINVKQNETKETPKNFCESKFHNFYFFFLLQGTGKKNKIKKAILIIAQLFKICITSWKKPHDMLSSIWHKGSAEEKRSH